VHGRLQSFGNFPNDFSAQAARTIALRGAYCTRKAQCEPQGWAGRLANFFFFAEQANLTQCLRARSPRLLLRKPKEST
jgi:hypothetical protein